MPNANPAPLPTPAQGHAARAVRLMGKASKELEEASWHLGRYSALSQDCLDQLRSVLEQLIKDEAELTLP